MGKTQTIELPRHTAWRYGVQLLEDLSDAHVAELALELVEEPWIREALKRKALTIAAAGWFSLVHGDGESLWPSRVVKVTRRPWRVDQKPAEAFLALYATNPKAEPDDDEPDDTPLALFGCQELGALNPAHALTMPKDRKR